MAYHKWYMCNGSICLCLTLFLLLQVSLSICLCFCVSVSASLFLTICFVVCICMSDCVSICLYACLPVCLSVCLSVCPTVFLLFARRIWAAIEMSSRSLIWRVAWRHDRPLINGKVYQTSTLLNNLKVFPSVLLKPVQLSTIIYIVY